MFRKNPRKRSAYLLLVLSVLCGLRAEAQQRGTIGWNRWRWGPAGVWTWDAACVLGRQRAAKSVGTVGLRAAIGSEGTWQVNAMMGVATGKDWTAHSGVRWGPKHVVTWRLDATRWTSGVGQAWGNRTAPARYVTGWDDRPAQAFRGRDAHAFVRWASADGRWQGRLRLSWTMAAADGEHGVVMAHSWLDVEFRPHRRRRGRS